ncbi:MAG: hypothetical protein ABI448_07070, partial [Bacteroidia bacterium]
MYKKFLIVALMKATSVFAQVQETSTQPSTIDKIKQRFQKEGLKIYLSNDSTTWLHAIGLIQVQARNDWNNPGSTVYGYAQKQTADVGIRSLRFQLMGQVTKHVFTYFQFGLDNFNYTSPRKVGNFFHDAIVEYKVWKKFLSIGGGLSYMGAPLRYSTPGVGHLLMADAPLYQ